ncbi:hypothetical protein [Planococcus beigongshangi]|uniref:hypothetical protein n=1 Tax=Planococcus beigongshangi TaxID=2782536 RepID=UPI00193B9820|nr:hypothetical protein [Planococcus beigongshangi]
MKRNEFKEELLKQINQFPGVKVNVSPTNPNRVSINVGTEKKRWMKIDENPTSLSVSMDHLEGELHLDDITELGITYGHQRGRNGVKVTDDPKLFAAVHFTFHENESYDFGSEAFRSFLRKHFDAYKKRISPI